MSNELNTENSIVTIIIEMSYKEDVKVIKEFIKEELGTFTVSKLSRFELFLNEDEQKATIIETFEDGDILDEIAEKLVDVLDKFYIYGNGLFLKTVVAICKSQLDPVTKKKIL